MYAKLSGNTVVKFPYTVGQLRKDNPNVSFPKNITDGVFNKYGVKKVHTLEDPYLRCTYTESRTSRHTYS
jgi:hypothetical protein